MRLIIYWTDITSDSRPMNEPQLQPMAHGSSGSNLDQITSFVFLVVLLQLARLVGQLLYVSY